MDSFLSIKRKHGITKSPAKTGLFNRYLPEVHQRVLQVR